MSPRSVTVFLRARTRSLSVPTLAALGLVAIVVAGMFATMLVTVRSLDATAKAQRAASELSLGSLAGLERVFEDTRDALQAALTSESA